ncbi:MAG: CDC27 family protein, partial [Treponema sp.]|nr:CDC27 family protein [Treponema sp.]
MKKEQPGTGRGIPLCRFLVPVRRLWAGGIVLGAALGALCLLAPVLVQAQGRTVTALYNAGRAAMVEEAWYDAAASFLEVLRQNPSHAESAAALAECYYELAEFDQALSWVRKGRTLARGNLALANLEGRILIALGQLNEA